MQESVKKGKLTKDLARRFVAIVLSLLIVANAANLCASAGGKGNHEEPSGKSKYLMQNDPEDIDNCCLDLFCFVPVAFLTIFLTITNLFGFDTQKAFSRPKKE